MYRPKDKNNQKGTEQKNDTKPSQPETHSYTYSPPPSNTTSNSNSNKNNNNNFIRNETAKSLEARTNSEKASTPEGSIKKPPPPVIEPLQAKHSPHKDSSEKPELSSQQTVRKEITFDTNYEHKKEVTHDLDYQEDVADIDYDEDDIYDDEDEEAQVDDSEEDFDDEDEVDLEEADGEDVSDIDDTELMTRLEAKYGKLPAKEYESDEDPDDPTWTRNY